MTATFSCADLHNNGFLRRPAAVPATHVLSHSSDPSEILLYIWLPTLLLVLTMAETEGDPAADALLEGKGDTILANPSRMSEGTQTFIDRAYTRRFVMDCGGPQHDMWVRSALAFRNSKDARRRKRC